MPLSVTIALGLKAVSADRQDLVITVYADGAVGRVETPWSTIFTQMHVVTLQPPAGGIKVSQARIKKLSQKQERKRIEAIGGRAHSGSGSSIWNKSDGSTSAWRMENKFTFKKSYSLKLEDLTKLRSECINAQTPVFNVEFRDESTGAVKDTWVLVPANKWEQLVNGTTNNR